MTPSSAHPWWIDTVRARAYRVARPVFGSLYANRSARVAWLGVGSVLISFGLTLSAPLWLLALGPVVLGVPHLVADARYLVIQPRIHQRSRWMWLALIPLVLTVLGAPLGIGLLAAVPIVVAAKGTLLRKIIASAALSALFIASLRFEERFTFALLHVHNVIAIGWWWSFRSRSRGAWVVLVLIIACTLFVFTDAALAVVTFFGAWNAAGSQASFTEFAQSHATLVSADFAPRLILSFAFLQSVHYVMWLRLVPEDARARPAARPFRETMRAMEADFGRPLLLVLLGLSLFVALWGAFNLLEARLGYLRLASFHGTLELAAAAFFFIEWRRPGQT